METQDQEILEMIESTREKVKKIDDKSITSLFILSNNKSDEYYAFWDTATTNVKIFSYGKKKKKVITPRS